MKKMLVLVSLVFYTTVLYFFNTSVFASLLENQEDELFVQTYTDNKYYNQVCWLTSHNSFAYKDNSFLKMLLHPNQEKDIHNQLLYGVRSFMIDLHHNNKHRKFDEDIVLAHKNDLTGGLNYIQRFSSPFLLTIAQWLDDPRHENDIITIHLESYIKDYDKIKEAIDVAGLGEYLFDLCEYNGGEAQKGEAQCKWFDGKDRKTNELHWPTLGEMRKQGKNLVIFSDKSEDAGHGIMHVSGTMETKYDISNYPNCEMRREGRSSKAQIFIMNHFYGWEAVPIVGNYYDYFKCPNKFVGHRVLKCFLQEERLPNFLAVDHVCDPCGNGDEKVIVLAINKISNSCCVDIDSITEEKHEDKNKEEEKYPEHDEL